ncbi:MAG: hypothetical protein RL304_753, partial [Verrucomicrobiota bacterium]
MSRNGSSRRARGSTSQQSFVTIATQASGSSTFTKWMSWAKSRRAGSSTGSGGA